MTGEGLSPAARALLDAARGGMAPDAATVHRMKSNVVSAAGASATAAIAIKLVVVAVVATLAAGAAIYGNHARSVSPPRIELSATHNESTAPVAQIRADSPTGGAPSTTPNTPIDAPIDAPIEMAPETMTRQKAAPTTGPSHAPAAVIQPARADLAREVELVDLAMSALRRGDTSSAVSAIRRHAAETRGAGQLAEDAAAIEIEALCRCHDPSVAAKLAAFDARFPRSAQRSRLSVTCP